MQQLDLFGHSATRQESRSANLLNQIQEFLEHCRNSRRLATHTSRAYASDLADFTRHIRAEASPADVSREDLLEYAQRLSEERKLKAATVRRRIATLKVFVEMARAQGRFIDQSIRPRQYLDTPTSPATSRS